jgi:hypothetical protein
MRPSDDDTSELATGIGGIGCARFAMFSGQRPQSISGIGARRCVILTARVTAGANPNDTVAPRRHHRIWCGSDDDHLRQSPTRRSKSFSTFRCCGYRLHTNIREPVGQRRSCDANTGNENRFVLHHARVACRAVICYYAAYGIVPPFRQIAPGLPMFKSHEGSLQRIMACFNGSLMVTAMVSLTGSHSIPDNPAREH